MNGSEQFNSINFTSLLFRKLWDQTIIFRNFSLLLRLKIFFFSENETFKKDSNPYETRIYRAKVQICKDLKFREIKKCLIN